MVGRGRCGKITPRQATVRSGNDTMYVCLPRALSTRSVASMASARALMRDLVARGHGRRGIEADAVVGDDEPRALRFPTEGHDEVPAREWRAALLRDSRTSCRSSAPCSRETCFPPRDRRDDVTSVL